MIIRKVSIFLTKSPWHEKMMRQTKTKLDSRHNRQASLYDRLRITQTSNLLITKKRQTISKNSLATRKRKVTYQFIDSYHSLCLDKKDIIYAELEACERLIKYASDEGDKKTVESEIAELKMALDLLT